MSGDLETCLGESKLLQSVSLPCRRDSSPFSCLRKMNSTAKIKQMADIRPLAIDGTDSILRSFHLELQQQ